MTDQDSPKRPGRFSSPRARLVLAGCAAAVLVAALVWWHFSGRESTDDAQVDGHITQVAPRVAGTVIKVGVKDNQHVEAGTVLVEIDPRDYRVAVERTEAELAAAEAAAEAARVGVPITRTETSSGVSSAQGGVAEAIAGVTVAERGIDSAKARLASAQAVKRQREAEYSRASKDADRLKALVAKEEIPQQQYDAAVTGADAARATLEAATASVAEAETGVAVAESRARQAEAAAAQAHASLRTARTAPEQLRVTRAQADAAAARVKQAQAALDQARLNLEYTVIKAPAAGVVSRKTVEVGQVLQAGQPVLALVNLDEIWITANFKETQVGEMRVGQRVRVEVDALDGRDFQGRIESIAAATGARFSLLPPENATGNYVKVVQRVPVKIVLDQGQDPDRRLRPGLSVVPTVFLK
jgi:membrane fusion protein (multidrug efflux system)